MRLAKRADKDRRVGEPASGNIFAESTWAKQVILANKSEGADGMGDLRDRIRGDETPAQRLLDWIPGFKGYRERETRREADRMVRQHLVGLLEQSHARIRSLTGDLAKQARLKQMTALDSLGKQLEKVTDLLRYADSGYTGWFSAVKIREEELDRLYEYDVSLKQFIADLDAAIEQLEAVGEDEMAGAVSGVESSLDQLEHMIRNREQVAGQLVP